MNQNLQSSDVKSEEQSNIDFLFFILFEFIFFIFILLFIYFFCC